MARVLNPSYRMPPDPQQLRREMKARRVRLSPAEIQTASQSVANIFWRLPQVQRVNKVGIYISVGGEIDCTPLIETGWLRKKRIFAPVLTKKRLRYAALYPGSKLRTNHFDILEPVCPDHELQNPRTLDVVVVPLLAFDKKLQRIGMGGGYYDRTFAFSKQQRIWRHPLLIGVAYSFQHVDEFPARAWDVPLHGVVTEREYFGRAQADSCDE